MGLVSLLKNNVSEGKFNLLIECLLSGNRYRSLAPSFLVNHLTELHHLESLLTERIENFESTLSTLTSNVNSLAETTINLTNNLNTLVKTVNTMANSTSNNQTLQGGGTSSAPSTPAVQETAPSATPTTSRTSVSEALAFLHQENLTINDREEFEESFSPISGAAPLTTEQMISKAGFNPFVVPEP
uniref:Uncharacterized protein n=1 Tax=Glomus sp. DAOM 240422 TaxID=1281822 RepID=S4UJM7_9GLOM|nr:hypothetical protein [Glomus sp. DAOM 240422]